MSDERPDENGRTHVFTRELMQRLRGTQDQRNGDSGRAARGVSYASISIAVATIGALGGFGVLAMDAGAQKQRIDTIEKRQVEDRSATGEKLNKLDSKVGQVDEKVNIILQELRGMQAEIRIERRAAAGRRERD
jgi:hypothetical protein